jgi:hypothetical protein
MRSSTRLSTRFPIGSKYVLEGRGPFVWRYVEFPDGRKVQLATRKAVSCRCTAREQISIIPDQSVAVVGAPSLSKKLARVRPEGSRRTKAAINRRHAIRNADRTLA